MMTSKTELKTLTMLRAAELTKDMETEHLHKLASITSEVTFEENKIIYQRGATGRAIYLIESGEVVIEMERPGQGVIIMNRLGPGQFFGWSSLFPGERKIAWTRTTKPTRAIAIDSNRLRQLWQADYDLEYAIVRRAGRDMANRIKNARRNLFEMLTEDSEAA